jgi:allantoate deiminase
MNAARKVMRRIETLARISEEPGRTTRTFASPAMRRANELVAGWMREAGMKTRVDAVGNLFGHYPAIKPRAKILLLGSHLDTVRNAGKFDGPLGVILSIACVERLYQSKVRLPFAIEVVGFADEEGVRYQTTYLGSKAVAGRFDRRDLKRKDADGISMAAAIKKFGGDPARIESARWSPKQLLGYIEAHIEQGPVLERKNQAVGVVTGIAGQTRAQVRFCGLAGHAGTVPMAQRRDALCAAAEFVLAVERHAQKSAKLVATVGQISAEPGASNVIPGEAGLTLDVRHASDAQRRTAIRQLRDKALAIARRRKTKLTFEEVHEAGTVDCCLKLTALEAQAIRRHQKVIPRLSSGAGHDAAVMAGITPVAMLFIRCKGGISHQPDESVSVNDVRVSLDVLNDFLLSLAKSHEDV